MRDCDERYAAFRIGFTGIAPAIAGRYPSQMQLSIRTMRQHLRSRRFPSPSRISSCSTTNLMQPCSLVFFDDGTAASLFPSRSPPITWKFAWKLRRRPLEDAFIFIIDIRGSPKHNKFKPNRELMDTPLGEYVCAARARSIRLRETSSASDKALVRSTPKLTEGFDNHAGYDFSSSIKDCSSSKTLGAYFGLAARLGRRGMEVSVEVASPVIRSNEAFHRNIREFPKRAASVEHPTRTAEVSAVATMGDFGRRRRETEADFFIIISYELVNTDFVPTAPYHEDLWIRWQCNSIHTIRPAPGYARTERGLRTEGWALARGGGGGGSHVGRAGGKWMGAISWPYRHIGHVAICWRRTYGTVQADA